MSKNEGVSRLATILSAVGTVGLVVVGLLSAPIVKEWIDNTPEDTWQKIAFTLVTLVSTMAGVLMILWFLFIFGNGIGRAFTITNLEVRINNNQLRPNETAVFDIVLKTRWRLLKGYVVLMITNRFGEITKIITHARTIEPEIIGDLRGMINTTLQARWTIPENAATGPYTARIAIHDVRGDEFNFLKERDYVLRGATVPFSVLSLPERMVTILRASKVEGGICIRIDNPTAFSYRDSTGRITIDKEELPLYDYKEYLANMNGQAKKMDLYSIFDLPNNSGKLLYAPTIKNVETIKVLLDVGQHTIEKELTIS